MNNLATKILFYICTITLITLFVSCKTSKQTVEYNFQLQEGDLLFQDSDCGPFCTSIEKVTFGYKGAKLSHIGMVSVNENNKVKIIEAISEGVVLTDLKTFLSRSIDAEGRPKVLVGRLDEAHRKIIPKAIDFAFDKLGYAYDEIFDINNDKYYCSELIYDAFTAAHNNIPLFYLQAMTFIDPDTGKTFPTWEKYYIELNSKIPEGKPGLNPGGISQSKYIDIVHIYGHPEGFDINTK